MPSKYLELELTELSDYQYFDRLVRFVTTMQKAGFKISIDDFGTGFSSMSLIRNLNPDVIKLDKSLIDNVAAGDDQKAKTDRVISRSIIKMAQELGIKVIAEGVETKEQAEFFRDVVFTAMNNLRAPIDTLEDMVDKTYWPVPAYGDMLFEV